MKKIIKITLNESLSLEAGYAIRYPSNIEKITSKIFIEVLDVIKPKKEFHWRNSLYSINKNLEVILHNCVESNNSLFTRYIGSYLGIFTPHISKNLSESRGYDIYDFSINIEDDIKYPPIEPNKINGICKNEKNYFFETIYEEDNSYVSTLKCEDFNNKFFWKNENVLPGILHSNTSKNLISIRELRWDTEADAMIQELSFIDLQTGKLHKTFELKGYTRADNIISYQNLVVICLSKGISCFDADSCQLIWEWKWIPKYFDYKSLNMDFKNTILHIIAGYEYHQLSVFDGEILLSNDLKPSLSKCKFYRVPKGKLPQQDNYIPIVSDTHLIFTQWEYMFFVNIVTGDIEYYYQLENALFNYHLYFFGDKLVARLHNYGKEKDSYPSLKVYELPQFT